MKTRIATAVAVLATAACTRHVPGPPLPPLPSTTTSSVAASESSPPPSPSMTPSPKQLEHLKTRVDDALDEINPAKDTLADGLGTHDFAALHIACGSVGKAGRDLSAALAEGQGYVLSSEVTQMMAQMQQAADALERTERDCLALGPSSTQVDMDKVATDMQEVTDVINQR